MLYFAEKNSTFEQCDGHDKRGKGKTPCRQNRTSTVIAGYFQIVAGRERKIICGGRRYFYKRYFSRNRADPVCPFKLKGSNVEAKIKH